MLALDGLEVAPACHNAHSLIMEGDSIEVAKIHRVSEVSVASVGCVVPRESCWVLGVAPSKVPVPTVLLPFPYPLPTAVDGPSSHHCACARRQDLVHAQR